MRSQRASRSEPADHSELAASTTKLPPVHSRIAHTVYGHLGAATEVAEPAKPSTTPTGPLTRNLC